MFSWLKRWSNKLVGWIFKCKIEGEIEVDWKIVEGWIKWFEGLIKDRWGESKAIRREFAKNQAKDPWEDKNELFDLKWKEMNIRVGKDLIRFLKNLKVWLKENI